MYILVFLLWLVLNAQVTWEIVFTGLGLVAVIAVLEWVLWGFTPKKEWKVLTLLPLFFAYAGVVIWNVICANMQMMGYILHKGRPLEPTLVEFESGLSHGLCRFLLSESITLTPGTITVRMEEGHLWIHAMSSSMMDGTEEGAVMRILRRMEARL